MIGSTNTDNGTTRKPVSGRLLDLLMALGAGMITWGFIHTQDPFFKVEKKYHISGLGEPDEKWSAYLVQQSRVDFKNAALVLGVLGGTLGAVLAIGGMARVSLGKRLFIGIVLGGLVGMVAGVAGCWLQQSFARTGSVSVVQSALVNALLFGILGLGLGGIVRLFSGFGRAVVDHAIFGLIVGIFAGIAYPAIAYVLMASVNIEALIPQAMAARLLWLGIVTSLFGLLLPGPVEKQLGLQAAEPAELHSGSAIRSLLSK